MKNTNLRNYILEQKEEPEFKPDEQFVLNLEKILNNHIQMIQNDSEKIQSDIVTEQKTKPSIFNLFQDRKYLLKGFLNILVVALIFLGSSYLYIENQAVTVEINRKEKVASILAATNNKVKEIKLDKKTVSYHIEQKKYRLVESKAADTNSFCDKYIDYNQNIEKEVCGILGLQNVPITQNIYEKGDKNFTEYPEFSSDYYKNLYGIDLSTATLKSEDAISYTISVEAKLSDSLKNLEVSNYETTTNQKAQSFNVELHILKVGEVVDHAKISYKFEREEVTVQELNITNIRFDPIVASTFKPSTKTVHNLKESNITAVINGNNYSLSWQGINSNGYIVVSTGYHSGEYKTILVKDFSPLTSDQRLSINIPFVKDDLQHITVMPYQKEDVGLTYGTGIEVFYASIFSNGIYKNDFVKIPRDEFTNVQGFSSVEASEAGASLKLYSSNIFENSKVVLPLPEDWSLAESNCEKECTSITLTKDNYSFTVDTALIYTGGGFGSKYDGLCYDGMIIKKSSIDSRYDLERLDTYFNSKDAVDSTCEIFDSATTSKWAVSRVHIKSDNSLTPLVDRGLIFVTGKQNQDYSNSILIKLEYATYSGSGVKIDYPSKDSLELKKMFEEFDSIVGTMIIKS